MDHCIKAGSWELPTYQTDFSLPQTQAKKEVSGLFKKIQPATVPFSLPPWPILHPDASKQPQQGCTQMERISGWSLSTRRESHFCTVGRAATVSLGRT